MKLLIKLLLTISLLSISQAFAGAGHSHGPDGGHAHGPISNAKVISKAMKQVKFLASTGKIDNSWMQVSKANAEQKTYSKGPEWVVTLANSNVSEKAKQTLYLFYTLDGHYIAANYTGQ